ncbi:MAG TPA: lysophospholipid acyltransferase family protein [Pirellulales bacterium]|jgi:1-acyl-sn-glycerol-3-phosphate acyltransferase|nr:lysophospholipid acyltransferase family protein [Pirellulales bacterium]
MLSDVETRTLAAGLLALLALSFVAWVLAVYRRTNFTPAQFPLYMLNLYLTRVRWRVRIEGRATLPPGQGAVIVCNHTSPIDPGFIALAFDRPVHWMVAKEYFQRQPTGGALRALQTIPVGRAGIDTAATKLAMRYARQGDLVGMFPEGRINTTPAFMLPGRPGAAMVALKAQTPVVPCYIEGSPYDGTTLGFLFMRARTRLKIGRPIDISEFYGREGDREVLEALTKRFMAEIAKLAGVADYVPELAGKRWKHGLQEV